MGKGRYNQRMNWVRGRIGSLGLLAGVLCLGGSLWAQQPPTAKQPPVPKSDPVPRSQPDDSADSPDAAAPGDSASKAPDKSSGNAKTTANAKDANKDANKDAKSDKAGDPSAEASAPPQGPEESSSKEARGDTAPPPDDRRKHPDSAAAIQEAEGAEAGEADATGASGAKDSASDKERAAERAADEEIQEFHPWDPHRAEKNIEVGDYYFKRKNYAGAEGRYREALLYKPGDAIATFQLAACLDKSGHGDEAKQYYAAYLKILPNGPSAIEAKQAFVRLGGDAAPKDSAKSK